MSAAWYPPSLPPEDVADYEGRFPDDPHRAAGEAWADYAASLPATPSVTSAKTGDQSVEYGDGGSEFDAANQRANWHLARAKARSVRMASHPSIRSRDTSRRLVGSGDFDPDPYEDRGTIPTVVM